MNNLGLLIFSVFLFVLVGCTAQNVTPASTVYNITITSTDNSQTITGENIQAQATAHTETKTISDIKPEVSAEAKQTTDNWLLNFLRFAWIFVIVVFVGWLTWPKWFIWIKSIF